jgi:perosamine synthetase
MNIPLFKIFWDDDDLEHVANAIRKGSDWANGPMIDTFEAKIADYIGNKYCVAFNSGTSALHALLLANGISSGDEVIVPSFTFISTANAPVFVQAKPVFADIERDTFGLDPNSVAEKISQNTRAIIPVHYGGCPCQIRGLRELADDHNLLLIEDAAEALGARFCGKKVGSFGDAAIFSFCQNKVISTGEGGAVTTDSKHVLERLKLIRSHGRKDCANYFTTSDYLEYAELGYNFRMSDISAALGVSQMNKADSNIAMRRENADYFSKGLRQLRFIRVPDYPEDCYGVYQLFSVEISGDRQLRDRLIGYLAEHHISSKIYFPPVHLTKFYRDTFGCLPGMLPVTENVADHILSLPMYPSLGTEEMDYIVSSLSGFQ